MSPTRARTRLGVAACAATLVFTAAHAAAASPAVPPRAVGLELRGDPGDTGDDLLLDAPEPVALTALRARVQERMDGPPPGVADLDARRGGGRPLGVYIRGNVGFSAHSYGDWNDPGNTIDMAVPGSVLNRGDIDYEIGFTTSAAVGLRFPSASLALELEVGYTTHDIDGLREDDDCCGDPDNTAGGETSAEFIALNLLLLDDRIFVDQNTWSMGGYVGGGVGYADVDFDVASVSGTSISGLVPAGSDSGVMWQALAGVTFTFPDAHTTLYAGVRAMFLPEVDLAGGIESGRGVFSFDFGVRFDF